MSVIDTIQALEKKNQNNKVERAKAEEREKALKEELISLQASLKEKGYEEKELSEKIISLETELNKQVEEIENILK